MGNAALDTNCPCIHVDEALHHRLEGVWRGGRSPPADLPTLTQLIHDVAIATKLMFRVLGKDGLGRFLLCELDNFDELQLLLERSSPQSTAPRPVEESEEGWTHRLLHARARIALWQVQAGGLSPPRDAPRAAHPWDGSPGHGARRGSSGCSSVAPGASFADSTTIGGGLSMADYCHPTEYPVFYPAWAAFPEAYKPRGRCGAEPAGTPPTDGRQLLGFLGVRAFYNLLQILREHAEAFRPDERITKPAPSSTPVENEMEDCAICFERLVTVVLPCAHAFCADCLDQWFRTQQNCPLCRAEVAGKTVRAVRDNSWELTDVPVPSRWEMMVALRRILQEEAANP
eukprot:EG_transcript_18277